MSLAILITVGVIFTLLGLLCVISVVVGLPGSWMILGMALVIELSDTLFRPAGEETFGWPLLIGALALAGVGELFEFLAGALGAQQAGSSRRGMIGAVAGGLVGAFAGIAVPVPLLGSLIGAVIGTFIGAIAGEMSDGSGTVRGSLKPATGATIGRVLGTLAKVPLALIIWAVLSVAVFWP